MSEIVIVIVAIVVALTQVKDDKSKSAGQGRRNAARARLPLDYFSISRFTFTELIPFAFRYSLRAAAMATLL